MLDQFETFFSYPKIQAATISVALSVIFIIVPLLQHRVRAKLTARQIELFDPVARDILIQSWLLFGSVLVYSLVAIIRTDLSFVSGDALPFVSLIGSLAAFWNIRRAAIAIKKATLASNMQRKVRLADVYKMSVNAYARGLIAFAYGSIALTLVLLVPEMLPRWLWFVSFLVTGVAINSLGWSIATLAVATEYEINSKLGRAKILLKGRRNYNSRS